MNLRQMIDGKVIYAVGTSEGAIKGWDTRGRKISHEDVLAKLNAMPKGKHTREGQQQVVKYLTTVLKDTGLIAVPFGSLATKKMVSDNDMDVAIGPKPMSEKEQEKEYEKYMKWESEMIDQGRMEEIYKSREENHPDLVGDALKKLGFEKTAEASGTGAPEQGAFADATVSMYHKKDTDHWIHVTHFDV